MTGHELPDGINIDLDDEPADDALEEHIRDATERVAEETERLLALALAAGYDGVDLTLTHTRLGHVGGYSSGFEWTAWNGSPEPLEPYSSGMQRYDFRTLGDDEKQVLLAYAGLTGVWTLDEDTHE